MNQIVTEKNEAIESSSNPNILKVFFFILKLFLSYLSYSSLTFIVVACVVFILVSGINFAKTELSFVPLIALAPIINFLGIKEKSIYSSSDVMILFSKLSFIFALIGSIISIIFEKVTGSKFIVSKKKLIFFHIFLISALSFVSIISCYFASAKKNALNIVPVLIIFWIITIGIFLWYQLLEVVKNFINKVDGEI